MSAISDPAEDNKSWIQEHPFALPVSLERIRLDQQHIDDIIRLNQWHFSETGNPLFCARALMQTGLPDDSRLAWAREWLANALGQLNALIDRLMPPESGKHREAILGALGFSTNPYDNPISEVRHIVEQDNIYVAVLLHGKPVTGAFQIVADRFNLSFSKVKRTYYDRKKLVDSLTQ